MSLFYKLLSRIPIIAVALFAVHYLLLGKYTVDIVFTVGNLAIVFVYIAFFKHLLLIANNFLVTQKRFQQKVFYTGVLFNILFAVILLGIYYSITGTLHNPEALDSKTYHNLAVEMADGFREGRYVDGVLSKYAFEDKGYVHILAAIYFLSFNSVFVLVLVQAIVTAYNGILIYKIGKLIFNEEYAARISAIVAVSFPLFVVFASIPVKATFISFSVLLSILNFLRIQEDRIRLSNILIIVLSLLALVSMRSFVGIILTFSFFVHIIFTKSRKKRGGIRTFISTVGFVFIFIYLAGKLGIASDLINRVITLLGLGKEGFASRHIGQNSVLSSITKVGGALGVAPFSLALPFPTFVETNITEQFNQTFKWYHIGACVIWNFFSFFSIVGFIISIRIYFRKALLLNATTIGYTIGLLASFYFTSYRHNILKINLLLIFFGIGVTADFKTKGVWFLIYNIGIFLGIVLWSLFKISSRGLI